jgi:hypothetical protein
MRSDGPRAASPDPPEAPPQASPNPLDTLQPTCYKSEVCGGFSRFHGR